MSNVNIKYQKGMVANELKSIEENMNSLMETKKTEYDEILLSFSVSQCDQATKLREAVSKEKEALEAMIEFYTKLATMIYKASKDVDQVESNYAETHVTG